MKIKLTILLTLLALSLHAQPTTNTATDLSKSVFGRFLDFIAANPEVAAATNWTFTTYASHAKGLVDSDGDAAEWGFGFAALYPLNEYIRAGARMQYFAGDWFMPSLNVQLQSSYKPFGGKLIFTPFVFTGIATPIGGSEENGDFGTLYGIGASLKYPINDNWEAGLGYAIETWSNLEVDHVDHFGLIVSYRF